MILLTIGMYGEAWGQWPSGLYQGALPGLYSFLQVTEVKLDRVRSNSGWVTSEA